MSDRLCVIKLLEKVEKGSYSTIVLNNLLSDMTGKNSAFITRAFYGVIERKITLDYIISKYSDKPLKKLPIFVLSTFRLCIYESLFMDNSQTFAAVNEAVEIIKNSKYKYLSGYANAILRNAVTYDLKYIENKSPDIKYSVNADVFQTVSNSIGESAAQDFFDNSLKNSEVLIMVNTLKCDENTIINDCAFTKTNVQNLLIANNFSPKEQHFINGDYFVIDSSAVYTVMLANPCPDDTILDLCAAPGGKTFCAAILSGNKNPVTALDLYPQRISLIKSTAKKLGIAVKSFVNDAAVHNENIGKFSLIICDVPCSGLGVVKRKPEIKYKNTADFANLPEIQLKILQTSANYVDDGGRILYSTCTLNCAENENVITKFLDNNQNFELVSKQYILPSQTGGDGFFAAVIKRKQNRY